MIHQSMFWMDMAVSLGVIGTIRHSEPQWMLTASAASKDGSTLWSAHVISDGCQCLCCETPRDPSTMSSSKMMLLRAKTRIFFRSFFFATARVTALLGLAHVISSWTQMHICYVRLHTYLKDIVFGQNVSCLELFHFWSCKL